MKQDKVTKNKYKDNVVKIQDNPERMGAGPDKIKVDLRYYNADGREFRCFCPSVISPFYFSDLFHTFLGLTLVLDSLIMHPQDAYRPIGNAGGVLVFYGDLYT